MNYMYISVDHYNFQTWNVSKRIFGGRWKTFSYLTSFRGNSRGRVGHYINRYIYIYTPFANHRLGCVKLPGCKTYCWFSEILHHLGYIKTLFFTWEKIPISTVSGISTSQHEELEELEEIFFVISWDLFPLKVFILYIYSEVCMEKNVWIFLKQIGKHTAINPNISNKKTRSHVVISLPRSSIVHRKLTSNLFGSLNHFPHQTPPCQGAAVLFSCASTTAHGHPLLWNSPVAVAFHPRNDETTTVSAGARGFSTTMKTWELQQTSQSAGVSHEVKQQTTPLG